MPPSSGTTRQTSSSRRTGQRPGRQGGSGESAYPFRQGGESAPPSWRGMQRALVLRIGFIKRRCKRGRIRIDNLNAPRKAYSFNATGGVCCTIPSRMSVLLDASNQSLESLFSTHHCYVVSEFHAHAAASVIVDRRLRGGSQCAQPGPTHLLPFLVPYV